MLSSTISSKPTGALLILATAITLTLGTSTARAQRPLGLDVSAWQGDISQDCWNQIYNLGYRFAFIRVTHYGVANGDPDDEYIDNLTRARAAGLIVGTYHYAIWSRTPQVEADYFLSYAAPYITAGYLPPMLDLEAGGNPATAVGATSICDWARQWIAIVKERTGVDAGIYMSGGNINAYGKAPSGCSIAGGTCTCNLSSQALWVADWCGANVCTACGDMNTAEPDYGISFYPKWTFWQYCSKGSIPCIVGNVDMDIFNGTLAELQASVIGYNAPPVISNIQATNVTNSSATISWTTDSASTSQVEYGLTSSYGSASPLNSTAVTAHSVALAALNSNTLYHFRVISTNGNGTSYSPDQTFVTSGPPAISGVTVSNVSAASATITWTTNAPATGQVFYGPTSAYGSQTSLDSTLLTSHSATLNGLQPTTLYHFKVASTNPYGSAQSADATFTTSDVISDVIVDNTDANCLVTNTWTTGTSAVHIGSDYIWCYGVKNTSEAAATHKVRWTPSLPSEAKYDIYIYYAAGTNRSTNTYWKVTSAGATLTYRVSERINGNDWTLLASDVPFHSGTSGYVELMNNTGNTTNVVQADAVKFVYKGSTADTQPPSVPTNLAAATITAGSAQLTWTAATDNVAVTGYKIYRDGAFRASVSANTYTDTDLPANTSCSYEVSAYDGVPNESGRSTALALTTLSVPPSNSTVVRSESQGCVGSVVTWTAVGGFGPGTIAYYRYAWDQVPTHTFTGSEPQWSSGSLTSTFTDAGPWYLHLQGYNSAQAANGTFDASVSAAPACPADFNQDCVVDELDFSLFQACASGADSVYPAACTLAPNGQGIIAADFDGDRDVDQSDFGVFQRCISGSASPADANCAN